jgi:hypothetical protein
MGNPGGVKMRPIAGNISLGYRFLELIQSAFLKKKAGGRW